MKRERAELDFEKRMPNKNKVYEIVKQLYVDLDTAKNSKSFNLTEAIFLLRSSDEYDFFAKENARIMFEKKIETINDVVKTKDEFRD